MCGIAGFYQPGHEFGEDELKAMTDSLAHRGPDAEGFYLDDCAGLGHRRLSIIDLREVANQPMFSADGRYVIVFNGEVYNFREIAEDLGVDLRTSGDTEVIVESFAKWGPECVHRFNGMFALAIYDTREKTLYLYRDRMGVKPIYYYWDGKLFAFASELKALLKLGAMRGRVTVNREAVSLYLHLGYIPQPHSIYNHIYKFPSGAYASLSGDKLKIQPYWKLEEKVKSTTLDDFVEAKAQLKALVESSVRYRMISDVPFGTFLSGGTDSSLVTAVAQACSPHPVKTFSIGFTEAKYNESAYAAAVAKHLGTEHHEYVVSHRDALALTDSILDSYDEPYADSSAIPTMLVSKLARERVTVTLSGDGGDELFFGYGMYIWVRRLSTFLLRANRRAIAAVLSRMNSRYKRAAHLFRFGAGDDLRSHVFSQEQYFFRAAEVAQVLVPDFQAGAMKFLRPELARELSVEEAQALFDLRYYLQDDLLVKVDRATMKYSLETRVPLLDYRIVEFALNLAPELKLRGGTMKYLLKELLYDYVPRELFDRPKWGFAVPLAVWMTKELRPLVEEYLSEESTRKVGVVRPEVVEDLKRRFFEGENYLYNRLWLLLILHKWLREGKG
jgi:asparagine synthase (glutamine-hydrolysing)